MAAAGLQWIQVRAKTLGDDELLPALETCARLRERWDFRRWVNARADLARLVGADGLHLGQDDLPPAAARACVGPAMWIGRSTHDLDQCAAAAADPDVGVVAFGPVFATASKPDAEPVTGITALAAARRLTARPLVAIGGIDAGRLPEVFGAGADGAAILGALGEGRDIAARVRALQEAAEAAVPR